MISKSKNRKTAAEKINQRFLLFSYRRDDRRFDGIGVANGFQNMLCQGVVILKRADFAVVIKKSDLMAGVADVNDQIHACDNNFFCVEKKSAITYMRDGRL